MLISSISPMNSTKTVTDTFTGAPVAKQRGIFNFGFFFYYIDWLHVWLISSLAHCGLADRLIYLKTMEEVIERLSSCCSTYCSNERENRHVIHAQSEATNSNASGTGSPEGLFSCSCKLFLQWYWTWAFYPTVAVLESRRMPCNQKTYITYITIIIIIIITNY